MENLQNKALGIINLKPVAVWGGGGDRAMAQGPAQSMPPRGPALERHKYFFIPVCPLQLVSGVGNHPKVV